MLTRANLIKLRLRGRKATSLNFSRVFCLSKAKKNLFKDYAKEFKLQPSEVWKSRPVIDKLYPNPESANVYVVVLSIDMGSLTSNIRQRYGHPEYVLFSEFSKLKCCNITNNLTKRPKNIIVCKKKNHFRVKGHGELGSLQ